MRQTNSILAAGLALLVASGCGGEGANDETDLVGDDTLAGTKGQGTKGQGTKGQGTSLGEERVYSNYAGMTKAVSGVTRTLTNVHIVRGELVAELGNPLSAVVLPTTIRGTQFANVQLQARGSKQLTRANLELRIRSVVGPKGDLGPAGSDSSNSTFLYHVQRYTSLGWTDLCTPDAAGNVLAIPVAATWNEFGDRVESTTQFTFACQSGVILKCYAWGYRPWVSSAVLDAHQACTRAARADYCGDGVSHTMDGTLINIWDFFSPQLQSRDATAAVAEMKFEAGWTKDGAVCLSHYRWQTLPATLCPIAGRRSPYPSQTPWIACPPGGTTAAGLPCDPLADPWGNVCDTCAAARSTGTLLSRPVRECNDSFIQ